MESEKRRRPADFLTKLRHTAQRGPAALTHGAIGICQLYLFQPVGVFSCASIRLYPSATARRAAAIGLSPRPPKWPNGTVPKRPCRIGANASNAVAGMSASVVSGTKHDPLGARGRAPATSSFTTEFGAD